MIKIPIDIVGVIFELLITHYFFIYLFKEIRVSKKIMWIAYGVVAVIMSAATLVSYGQFVLPLVMILSICSISLFYKGKIFVEIFFGVIIVFLFMAAEGVVGALIVFSTKTEMSNIQENMMLYSTGVLGSKLLVFLFVKIVGFNRSGLYKNLSKRVFFALVLTPISSLVAMYTVSINLENYKSNTSMIIVLCSSVLLIVSNVFVFFVFERQIENEHIKARLEYTEKQLEQQIENYRQLSKQQAEVRKLSHDMKHYVYAMKQLNNTDNERHIESINKKLSEYESFYDTGHPAIDALLHAKNNEMKNLGIDFTTSIILPEKINVDALDLCVVLGNAIDNAIEACEKMDTLETRFSNLRVVTNEKYISIHLENPTGEDFTPTNEKKTTKNDSIRHGYGLDSIKAIATKYDGNLKIECKDFRFCLSVLLKN